MLGLTGFSWFQIVSMSPSEPETLVQVMAVYYAIILTLGVLEGEDWLEQGEFLTVFMGYLAKVAPFWLEIRGNRARLMRGLPGTQILAMPPLSVSAMAFITLALAALTFDGLMETFWWHAVIGENPLEFTGRSAVQGVNTAGLLAVWALGWGYYTPFAARASDLLMRLTAPLFKLLGALPVISRMSVVRSA